MGDSRSGRGGLTGLIVRLLRRRRERGRNIEDELTHHLDERVDRLVEEGWSRPAARREAERRFGSIERVRRACRSVQRRGDMEAAWRRAPEQLLRELRIATRVFRQSPGFAAAVVATLALGVGASTAVYSVTDALLLRPLPYHQPDRLVSVYAYDAAADEAVGRLSGPMAAEWRLGLAGRVVFQARRNAIRTDGEHPSSILLSAVSPNWLDVLEVAPALGRSFTPEEAVPGRGHVAILSHDYWRDAFGADTEILGRTVRLDDRAITIVGVMPRGFEFPRLTPAAAWVPIADDASALGRAVNQMTMMARIPDDERRQVLADRLSLAVSGLEPLGEGGMPPRVELRPFDEQRANSDVVRALWLVTAAVVLMQAIAVANVVNLQLVRGVNRRSEFRVRSALGASHGRILRQTIVETLTLAAVAGGFSLLLAEVLIRTLVTLLPGQILFFVTGEIGIDSRVFLFALAATVAAGLIAGLVPGFRLARTTVDGRSPRGRRRLGNALVVAEIAVSIVLLIGAALFARSFVRLTAVEPGFDVERVLYLSISPPAVDYPDPESRGILMQEIRDAVATLPGVESASLALGTPPDASFHVNVRPQAEGGEPLPPQLMLGKGDVTPGFFETVGIRIARGRDFAPEETPEHRVAIIDEDFARALWPDTSAVGERFRVSERSDWLTVVGVLEDVKMRGIDDRDGRYSVFRPLRTDEIAWGYTTVAIRASADPSALVPAVREAVGSVDPGLPIARLETGAEAVAETIEKPRFLARLMVVFGALSLVLAGVGIYGVLAFTVRQRRREIGVRAALGATAGEIRRRIVGDGLLMGAAGVGLGVACWLLVGQVIESLLYATSANDPMSLLAAAGLILVACLAACWWPAARATRVDPAEVLRVE